MLNSGLLRIDAHRAGFRTHAIAAAIFATYPLWLWLGLRAERRKNSMSLSYQPTFSAASK